MATVRVMSGVIEVCALKELWFKRLERATRRMKEKIHYFFFMF